MYEAERKANKIYFFVAVSVFLFMLLPIPFFAKGWTLLIVYFIAVIISSVREHERNKRDKRSANRIIRDSLNSQ